MADRGGSQRLRCIDCDQEFERPLWAPGPRRLSCPACHRQRQNQLAAERMRRWRERQRARAPEERQRHEDWRRLREDFRRHRRGW